MLTDAQKKRIEDAALGESITSQVSVHDQVAALRKQVLALSTAGKVKLVDEMMALETTVAEEKKKRKHEPTPAPVPKPDPKPVKK